MQPGTLLGNYEIVGLLGTGGVSGALPGLLTITAFSESFFGASYTLVAEREQGILRRFWVTPASDCELRGALSLGAVPPRYR